MLTSIAAVFALLAAGQIESQVIFREPSIRSLGMLHSNLMDDFPTYTLSPMINNEQLIRQEESSSALFKNGVFQFGKSFEVDLSLKDGHWTVLEDGTRLWHLAIESQNAHSLNLIWSDFKLPDTAELYVVPANDRDEAIGPFTASNNKDDGGFSIWPVRVNKMILELYVDVDTNVNDIHFTISNIVHGYRDVNAAYDTLGAQSVKGVSGSCNINVACSEGDKWRNQIRGVVVMINSRGTGFCSGSMVNNLAEDGRQLFLTANHCTGGADTGGGVKFNYQASACNSRSAPDSRQTAMGMNLLASTYASDFALFEIKEAIPADYNVYLNGWSALLGDYAPANPVGIHHPSVDIKKISFSYQEIQQSCWSSSSCRKPDHWKIPKWDKGTTEPGSSGSPLFDGETQEIVGQLHGGSASCYNLNGYDVYGKIQYSFDGEDSPKKRLAPYLDPEGTGVRRQSGVDLNTLRKRLHLQ